MLANSEVEISPEIVATLEVITLGHLRERGFGEIAGPAKKVPGRPRCINGWR